MLDDLKQSRSKVEFILRKHPETRDSDKLLWLAYLCIFRGLRTKIGIEAYNKFRAIVLESETPVMESISRVRRKIQAEGKYQGKKRKERLEEEESVRDFYKEQK